MACITEGRGAAEIAGNTAINCDGVDISYDAETHLIDRMAAALRSLGCRCEHNVPYTGCKIPQFVTRECARCRCLRDYDELSPPSSPARIAQASAGCRGDAAGGGL